MATDERGHEWKPDYSLPVMDMYPQIIAVDCVRCGRHGTALYYEDTGRWRYEDESECPKRGGGFRRWHPMRRARPTRNWRLLDCNSLNCYNGHAKQERQNGI
jgi:hypothetical protein